MAELLFSEGVFQQLILHRQFGVHLLEPALAIVLGPMADNGSPSAIAFISDISEASMPPYLLRQL